MTQAKLALTSHHRICRAQRQGACRDALLDHGSNGLFAIVSGDGAPADVELATRAICEILRRSVDLSSMSFADGFLVAEEALVSILGVLQDDAELHSRDPVEISFVVALVAGGWLGLIGHGGGTLHLMRRGSLFRVAAGPGVVADDASFANRQILGVAAGDRLFLASAGLSGVLDEGTLATEFTIDDLGAVDRIAERYRGGDDVSAIGVKIGDSAGAAQRAM